MKLDIEDLENWSDADVMKALNEIEDGLTDNDLTWVDRLTSALKDRESLSERQRETADSILRKWNSKQ